MQKFLRGFFWFAFASFLAASIPHVAYFFRAFEPQGDGQDMLWWGVSLAIAISIDITIFLLSVTVAGLHRRGSAGRLIASVWFFILGLTALSWFINWEYAREFQSLMLARASTINLDVLSFNVGKVGDINPLIASMFQVLAIAYTWIADKIASDEKPKTAAELKAEADELAAVALQKRRIAAIKHESNKGFISGLGDTVKHARAEIQQALQTDHAPAQETTEVTQELPEKLQKTIAFLANNPNGTDEELAEFLGLLRPASARFWRLKAGEVTGDSAENQPHIAGDLAVDHAEDQPIIDCPPGSELAVGEATEDLEPSEHITEHSPGVNIQSTADVSAEEKAEDEEPSDTENTPMDVSAHMPPFQDRSRGTVSIDDAAKLLGFSVKYVRELRSKGTLKTASRNRNRITIKSINAVLLAREKNNQSIGEHAAIPQLQIISSEQQNGHKGEAIPATLIVVNADEKAS